MSRAFIGLAHRTCTYCKDTGHTKYNCQRARDRITLFKQQINVCKSSDSAILRLTSLFESKPLTEICLLMINVFGMRMKSFIQELVRTEIITDTVAKMRYKKDRITILLWYYWHSAHTVPKQRKLNIVAIMSLEPDLSSVDCPICVECKPASEKIITNCNHCICKTCIDNYFEHQLKTLNFPKPLCVLCRTTITSVTIHNNDYMTELSTKYLR